MQPCTESDWRKPQPATDPQMLTVDRDNPGLAIDLKRRRNSQSPLISRLPPEVLSKILVSSLWFPPIVRDSWSPGMTSRPKTGRSTISEVCHAWRSIALGTVAFWSRIQVRGTSSKDYVAYILRNAKGSQLDLEISFHSHKTPARLTPAIELIRNVILNDPSRVQSLRLFTNAHSVVALFSTTGSATDVCRFWAPNLQLLEISGVCLPWNERIFHAPRLTHLVLHNWGDLCRGGDIRPLVSLLRRLPQLQQLQLGLQDRFSSSCQWYDTPEYPDVQNPWQNFSSSPGLPGPAAQARPPRGASQGDDHPSGEGEEPEDASSAYHTASNITLVSNQGEPTSSFFTAWTHGLPSPISFTSLKLHNPGEIVGTGTVSHSAQGGKPATTTPVEVRVKTGDTFPLFNPAAYRIAWSLDNLHTLSISGPRSAPGVFWAWLPTFQNLAHLELARVDYDHVVRVLQRPAAVSLPALQTVTFVTTAQILKSDYRRGDSTQGVDAFITDLAGALTRRGGRPLRRLNFYGLLRYHELVTSKCKERASSVAKEVEWRFE